MEIPIFDPQRFFQVEAIKDHHYQDFLVKIGIIERKLDLQPERARELLARIHCTPIERDIVDTLFANFGYLVPTVDIINDVWRRDKFIFGSESIKIKANQTLVGLKLINAETNLRTHRSNINKKLEENLDLYLFSGWHCLSGIGVKHVHLRPINMVLLYRLYQSDRIPQSPRKLYSSTYGSYDLFDFEKNSALVATSIYEIRDTLEKLCSPVLIRKVNSGYQLIVDPHLNR